MFLGLVGIPWSEVPAFVEAATPLAQAVEAAGVAAEAAAAAAPALILGAGLLGWEIGTQLRKAFVPSETAPFPAPQFPFRGGQGVGNYNVTVEYTLSSLPHPVTTNGTVPGPIAGVVQGKGNLDPDRPSSTYTVYGALGASTFGSILYDDDVVVAPHITNLEPVGFTDPGVDPPYEYPLAPVSPGVLNPTIPVPGMPGSPEFPGTIVPFPRPNPTTTPPSTDPGESEDPKVIVQIPDLGTQIQFEPGGVSFPSGNLSPSSRPQIQNDPRSTPPKVLPPICECPCDDSEVLAKIKEVKDEEDEIKKLVTPPEYDHNSAVRLTGTGGSFTLQALARAVRVQITVTPVNKEGYDGGGGGDIVFAGWHAFGSESVFGGKRIPIQYYDNGYQVPANAGTFTCGIKSGYGCIVTEYWDTLKMT